MSSVLNGRHHVACALLDVFPDMGVIPSIVHSDDEFCSLAFEEPWGLAAATAWMGQGERMGRSDSVFEWNG